MGIRLNLEAIVATGIFAKNVKAFIVTGITTVNRRFTKRYSCEDISIDEYSTAMQINLYRGSVWAEFENGKRKLLKRVNN